MDINFIDIIPSLTFLAAALFRFVPALTLSAILLQRLEQSKPSIESICQKLSNNNIKSHTLTGEDKFDFTVRNEITIKDLSYAYNNSPKKLFNNLNLNIKIGEKIAIHGKSGSGKTTLVKLLMGIIPVLDGEILIDKKNINTNTKSWQKIISYIPQKVFLFESSLKENREAIEIAKDAAINEKEFFRCIVYSVKANLPFMYYS